MANQNKGGNIVRRIITQGYYLGRDNKVKGERHRRQEGREVNK
jgi:hypothetical protein